MQQKPHIFLTLPKDHQCVTAKDVMELWNSGAVFREYQAYGVTKEEIFNMTIMGLKLITYVWQTKDHVVHHHVVNLE